MWRKLPEKQKRPFEEKAKRLREEWMAKMKTYKANLPEGGYQVGHFAYLICLICLSISSIYLSIY